MGGQAEGVKEAETVSAQGDPGQCALAARGRERECGLV